MAPRGHPDDEITGYEGWIGLGGSVSLRPVRARDRYRQGRGCCLGTLALVVLGIVAAWVLEHVVARRGRGDAAGGSGARPSQHRAVAAHARPAATARLGTPGCPDCPGAPGTSRTAVASARTRGAIVS